MAYSPTTPVTGGAQTGFTSPTYTIALDSAPTHLGKQYAVTALGGTQTGASANTPTVPFRANFVRPAVLKSMAAKRSNSNQLTANNRNIWKFVVQKGALLDAGSGIYGTATFRGEWDIPAGMDLASPAELRAMLSFIIGLLNQQSAGIGDTFVSGVV